jgi:zinc protease
MKGRGYAYLGGELITYGSANKTKSQIEDELNTLKSSLVVHSNASGLLVTFNTTKSNWPAFSAVLKDMLRAPTLSEEAFQIWKRWKITNLEGQKDSPTWMASNALFRALYVYDKADPRYTTTYDESLAQWHSLRYEDVKRFWADFAGASVSEFTAVGALDVALMQSDVATILEGWISKSGATYQRIPYPLPPYASARFTLPTPDKPNANLLMSQRFHEKGYSKEWLSLFLANSLIGGHHASRLFTKLRKEEGLTYDVKSTISGDEDDQVIGFSAEGTFAPANLVRFETALQTALAEIHKLGFTEQELVAQKRMEAQRIVAGRENDANLALGLANNERRMRQGLRSDFVFWDEVQQSVQALTLEDVNAAARRLVDTSKTVTVITGDFKK